MRNNLVFQQSYNYIGFVMLPKIDFMEYANCKGGGNILHAQHNKDNTYNEFGTFPNRNDTLAHTLYNTFIQLGEGGFR